MKNTRLEEHLDYPVLREVEPIELARIPVSGDQLQDSVILHPRYVPKDVDYEIFKARVYRRGRTLDLFLDEPIIVDGTEYGILNFKGVGAQADRSLIIHPDKWYTSWNSWTPRQMGDRFNRVWGALTKGKARREFPARLFHQYNIPHAPHLALNDIPKKVTQYIKKSVHGTERHNLVQLVRGLQTNIRMDNHLLTQEQVDRIDIHRFASIDAQLIKTQFALARKNKMLGFEGDFTENRFIDGTYTDAENLFRSELARREAVYFLLNVVGSIACRSKHIIKTYYQNLERETGLPFASLKGDFTAEKLLIRELDLATGRRYKDDYSQTLF